MMTEKLILGTVQFGLDYGINNTAGKVPFEESCHILKKAMETGVQVLDTAEAYGDAHQVIGKFHQDNPDSIFRVVTKLHSVEKIELLEKSVDDCLAEMEVQQLEGLMFHSFHVYDNHRHVLPRLIALKSRGLIGEIGVSVYTNEEMLEVLDDDSITLIQLPFNLLDNVSRRGNLIARGKQRGKTIHTRSAFLQGLFFLDPANKHPVLEGLRPQLKMIRDMLAENNMSMEALALGYCIAQPNIDRVLIGVDSVAQFEANIEAGAVIDDLLIQQINGIETADGALLNPSLWSKYF